ncbi:MAG: glycosyltransferase family 2 protein [Pseudolabrys sp.]|nr:glycosyltransferase family 2 protein [Pseudolabrys sp.]
MPTLSAVIITRDEAANIGDCIATLDFCDEVIVVDSFSSDNTVELARAKGARVEQRAFDGFGAQKQHALSLAAKDWVLSIDADERVSPALAAEIRQAIAASTMNGYEMPRSSIFCGRVIRHSGWAPDYVLRLVRRGRARFSERLVHEQIICEGPVGRLKEPLIHYAVDNLSDAIDRIDRYSTAGAQMMMEAGRRVWFISGITRGVWAFLRHYIFRAGFLDGAEGYLVAVTAAHGTFYRYMKAWLLQRARSKKP